MVRLITGEQECNNQSLTEAWKRGQDKSRQCAARSVVCFYLVFPSLPQRLPRPPNVRAGINALIRLSLSHIAQIGDGLLGLGRLSPQQGRD